MDIDSLVAVSCLTDSLSRASTLDSVYTAALDALQSSLGVERASLQSFGASAVAVGSANAALDALRAGATSVVVSDIAMPGEDGYSLMMKIRSGAVERAQNVPAVALTAYARAEDRERILASGFAFHLTKPVDPVAMARVIRESARR